MFVSPTVLELRFYGYCHPCFNICRIKNIEIMQVNLFTKKKNIEGLIHILIWLNSDIYCVSNLDLKLRTNMAICSAATFQIKKVNNEKKLQCCEAA